MVFLLRTLLIESDYQNNVDMLFYLNYVIKYNIIIFYSIIWDIKIEIF